MSLHAQPHDPICVARTQWLNRLTAILEPAFQRRGLYYPPNLKVEAGLSDGQAEMRGGFVSGVTMWPRPGEMRLSTAATSLLGISPVEMEPDSTGIIIRATFPEPLYPGGVLIHELIHACLPPEEGHGPTFEAHARAFGLIGPPETTANGPWTNALITRALDYVGPYPEAPADFAQVPPDIMRWLMNQ